MNSNENENESAAFDNRSSAEIISDRIEMLGAVFNRKITEELKQVFEEALHGYSRGALKRAFIKAERQLERFPTPKIMRSLCNEETPAKTWRYEFEISADQNPEGQEVTVLIDPDPVCYICREPKSVHPVKLSSDRSCPFFKSELGDDRVMYRPQDCKEGREFLLKFRQIAGKK
jgi:hypothetical protein